MVKLDINYKWDKCLIYKRSNLYTEYLKVLDWNVKVLDLYLKVLDLYKWFTYVI